MGQDYCVGYSMGWNWMFNCPRCECAEECRELSSQHRELFLPCNFKHTKDKLSCKQCQACKILFPNEYRRCIEGD